jgi:hypothetical protein
VAPSEKERVFVAVRRDGGRVEVGAIAAPWGAPALAAVRWHMEDADDLLLGDVRATLDGAVRVGLVVRRGTEWRRVVFTSPRPDEWVVRDVAVDAFTPPAAADGVRARLDLQRRH